MLDLTKNYFYRLMWFKKKIKNYLSREFFSVKVICRICPVQALVSTYWNLVGFWFIENMKTIIILFMHMCIYFFSHIWTYTHRYVFSHFIYEILGSVNSVTNFIIIRSIKVLQTIEKIKNCVFRLTFKCNLLLFVIEILALLRNVSL